MSGDARSERREARDGSPTASAEGGDEASLELLHAVHVGGGQVPHRVRAFIRHMVDAMKASPLT